ncbi:MBL fold metallo-hydrolase [Leptospira sp. GIMC2001]|uniref:MBL fold metallo-hydrolase n=1 Tax=Leptospira sp. GIMC2001 TaxID=1513297 RepID=UPI0004A5C44C|nr:MBL fold metallo-hydrolase [Leptospira sp. GIMC2001]AID56170.1 metallo-beta-lactamase superfamily protein [Leptospira sp. GIMC2001]WCL50203.1 MBL fold metallo-hydrolase [Leptospira sp. GIMC2001]
MEMNFYGVRGSCPTPISKEEYKDKVMGILDATKQKIKEIGDSNISTADLYEALPDLLKRNIGGNTTCLCFTSKNDNKFIFDMGTGIRNLGNDLIPRAFGSVPLDLNIFMTHTHWDHIQGWPFFKPAYSPNVSVNFYSCIDDLQERLERQQWEDNFPLPFQAMASKKTFTLLTEKQQIQIGDFQLTPFALKHPGSCTGYRIADGDKAVFFCTDVELREDELESLSRWKETVGSADVLIIDAQYSTDEADKKIGWGHTSVKMAVKAGVKLGAKKVVLTHFEPDHTDASVMEIIHNEIHDYDHDIEVIVAYEGMTLSVN